MPRAQKDTVIKLRAQCPEKRGLDELAKRMGTTRKARAGTEYPAKLAWNSEEW